MKKVVVIGGGSSAHTVIPLLSKAGYEINLLTSRPESWKKKISLEYQSETGEIKERSFGSHTPQPHKKPHIVRCGARKNKISPFENTQAHVRNTCLCLGFKIFFRWNYVELNSWSQPFPNMVTIPIMSL